MTDREMLEDTAKRLMSFAKKIDTIHTGNLAHEGAGLKGLLRGQAFLINHHLEED